MRWLNALERRFGHWAIPGPLRIVVAFNVLVYLLILMQPGFAGMLDLQPDRIYQGQVWRLFTYVFIPPIPAGTSMGLVFMYLYLSFLWLVGEGLEQAWGSFRLNVYYLLGMLGTTIAMFALGSLHAAAGNTTGFYLNLSLLFAFATLFPDYPIWVMFILPVKVKWLALFSLVSISLSLLGGTLADHVAITVSLANYLIFFGPMWFQHMRARERVAERQQQFQMAAHVGEDETLHHCKVCGRTEVSSPELEFRVASDGEEYCLPHLPSRRAEIEAPPPLPL